MLTLLQTLAGQSSLKFTSTINNSGIDFYQLIETKNVIPLQGKVVTLSAYVAGTNGKTASGMTAYYSNTNDDMIYLTSGVLMQNIAIPSPLSSTSFQRISMTFTVPSTAKTIRIGLISNVLNNTEFINWAGVKLEVGSVATPFSRVGGSFVSELAACQRYYYRDNANGQSLYYVFAHGSAWSTTQIDVYRWFPVIMRSTPSFTYSGTIVAYDGQNQLSPSSVGLVDPGLAGTGIRVVVVGATQYRPYHWQSFNNAASYVEFSAEI